MNSTDITRHDGTVVLDDAAARQLAAHFGTPLFVYNAEIIRDEYSRLTNALSYRPLSVYYSVKANSAVGLLSVLRKVGAMADVCSLGDIVLAESAGFPDAAMSFTGSGLSYDELAVLASRPDIEFVADSLLQVERFAELCCGQPIGLRINPAIDAGFHPHVQAGSSASRFGLSLAEVPQALELASRAAVPITGLHGHLGSDIFYAGPYRELVGVLAGLAKSLPHLRWLNLGGGLGVPRNTSTGSAELLELSQLDDYLVAAFRKLNASRSQPLSLRVEPGGFLTMTSGLLLTRVTDLKSPRGDSRSFLGIVDASSNLLPSAVMYDTYHPLRFIGDSEGRPERVYDIAGNLMLAGDILARDRQLPELRIDDMLGFGRCGAYSSSRATTFNNRGRAAEVLLDDGKATLLRRRESETDMRHLDVIPAVLALDVGAS